MCNFIHVDLEFSFNFQPFLSIVITNYFNYYFSQSCDEQNPSYLHLINEISKKTIMNENVYFQNKNMLLKYLKKINLFHMRWK